MITAHTDVVGSLLRPSELLRAREKIEKNTKLTAGILPSLSVQEMNNRPVPREMSANTHRFSFLFATRVGHRTELY